MAHRPSCSAARGILPDQGSNLCPLHWQEGVPEDFQQEVVCSADEEGLDRKERACEQGDWPGQHPLVQEEMTRVQTRAEL